MDDSWLRHHVERLARTQSKACDHALEHALEVSVRHDHDRIARLTLFHQVAHDAVVITRCFCAFAGLRDVLCDLCDVEALGRCNLGPTDWRKDRPIRAR